MQSLYHLNADGRQVALSTTCAFTTWLLSENAIRDRPWPLQLSIERFFDLAYGALDAAQAAARLAAQMPLCEKKALADFVVDNQDTPQSLRPVVEDLYAQLLLLR